MADCNLTCSGHTGVISAGAYVYEQNTSGTIRSVRLILQVWAIDSDFEREGGYSVSCSESGTDINVPAYSGFTITGSPQTIFDEIIDVDISGGSSTASVDLSFSAWLLSPSAGERRIQGSITELTLTREPEAPQVEASSFTLSESSLQMGKKLIISIDRADPGCTHTLKYTVAGNSAIIATKVGSSYSWTVPDLTAKFPDATSGTCTVTCITYYGGDNIGSRKKTLKLTVPDATTPAITDSTVTLGQKSTIACRRNSDAFTLRLEFDFQDTTYTIKEGTVDTVYWTPKYALAAKIPALTHGTGTLRCVTMNGKAVVGTTTVTIRVNVPNNSTTRPKFTLSGLTLSPVSSLAEEFTGLYIRGKTGVKAEFSATSDYSTIQSCKITVGSQSASGNPATISTLVNDGSVKVTAKVTDARGYATSVTTTLPVIPYNQPKVIPYTGYAHVLCERALDTGELSPRGTFLAVKAGKSFSSIPVNGKEANGCTLQYRWKATGGSFSSWKTLLAADSPETEVSSLVSGAVSSLQKSYLVEIRARDTLGGTHRLTFQIMTQDISFVLYDGPDGAAFGKYPEEPHVVDIASHMKLKVRGLLEVTGEQWTGLTLAEGIRESTYQYGHAPDNGCFYRVTNGNHVHVAFNCAFEYTGQSLNINADMLPAQYRPARWVTALCLTSGRCIATVSMNTYGLIQVEFVQKLTDTVTTGAASVTWIDGYLDYFI